MPFEELKRRSFLALAAASAMAGPRVPLRSGKGWTQFQLACMTLPYSQFPLERALKGIASAGFAYVAWGISHQNEPGRKQPVMPPDAPVPKAKALAGHCRDLGLRPVMMFSEIYVGASESVKVHTHRIEQAANAGIPFVLTFGSIAKGGGQEWIRNLGILGPLARQHGVTIVIKQHGGNTATGADCARIIADVADEGVKMCYDAGNVLDYDNHDPIADIQTCWKDIRAFAIKDHRNTPKDQDCGPGFGEIDHYKLFAPIMRTEFTMPLAFENISVPLLAPAVDPAVVDADARRSREYIENVLAGLQSVLGPE